jgi:hypothetical protein
MIALKKNPKATKCTEPRTMSPNTHATKLIAKTNKRRIGKKIVEVPLKDQFGFRKEKLTTNAFGMQGIILARTLDVEEQLCACFID